MVTSALKPPWPGWGAEIANEAPSSQTGGGGGGGGDGIGGDGSGFGGGDGSGGGGGGTPGDGNGGAQNEQPRQWHQVHCHEALVRMHHFLQSSMVSSPSLTPWTEVHVGGGPGAGEGPGGGLGPGGGGGDGLGGGGRGGAGAGLCGGGEGSGAQGGGGDGSGPQGAGAGGLGGAEQNEHPVQWHQEQWKSTIVWLHQPLHSAVALSPACARPASQERPISCSRAPTSLVRAS